MLHWEMLNSLGMRRFLRTWRQGSINIHDLYALMDSSQLKSIPPTIIASLLFISVNLVDWERWNVGEGKRKRRKKKRLHQWKRALDGGVKGVLNCFSSSRKPPIHNAGNNKRNVHITSIHPVKYLELLLRT